MRLDSDHWFWGEVSEQRSIILLVIVASLFANIFAFAVSLFSMVVYDRILPNNAVDSLISLLIGLSIILVMDYSVRQVRSEFLEYAGRKIDAAINAKLFSKMVLGPEGAIGRNTSASVSLIKDFDVIREFMAAATVTAIVDIPFSILFLFVIYIISGSLVSIPLIVISALLVVGIYSNYKMRHATTSLLKVGQGKQAILYECLTARDSIICLGNDEFFSKKWARAINEHAVNSRETKRVGNGATNLVNFLTQTNQIAIVSAGVVSSALTGSLIATTLLAGRAIAPFAAIVNLLTRLSHATQAFKSISRALQPAAGNMAPGMVKAPEYPASIKFEKLVIQYAGSKSNAIDFLDLSLEAGDRVAILGKTGSGKSTLIRALLSLTPMKEGAIKIDGVNISDFERTSFLKTFSVLHQDTHLFAGSIIQNITIDDELADPKRIRDVCEASGFLDVLNSLPEGLNTTIGENGNGLSGGQKRLLALARFMYNPRPILVMDEPTGNLDPATEALVVKNMSTYMERCKIAIFVTHRPAPLRLANKILIMNNGKIIEYGARDAILDKINKKAVAV